MTPLSSWRMMNRKKQDLFCKECMSPSTRGFKKVIALKNSGLLFYLHTGEETKKNAADKSKSLGVFILHNDSEYDLRRPDYAIEMCQLRTRCFRCINIVKRVRSLLDEFNFIKKNQVIGLCEHCKRNPGACKKCQYIVNKFLDNKTELHKEKQEQFKSWLSQLNQFLHYVLNDENLDQINNDPSALELERLLEELKHALELRKLNTAFFPTDLTQLSSMTAGNEMIDDLLAKIKLEDLRKLASDENLPPIGEGMQLLPKQHQKDSQRRLPPVTRAIQKKTTDEWIKKDNVSEKKFKDKPSNVTESQKEAKKEKHKSISEMTSNGSTSKTLKKTKNLKNQSKGKPGNVTGTHRKREINKENNKVVSETSATKPLETKNSKPLEKNNTTKNQSEDKPGNVTETHRKREINKENNKVVSETSATKPLETKNSKPLEKNDTTKNQSEDKPGNVTETHRNKKDNEEKNKTTPEIKSKGTTTTTTTSKLLEKKNATKNQFKEKPGSITETHRNKENKTEYRISEIIFSNDVHDVVNVKYNQKGKNIVKDNQKTISPFANMELPLVRTLGAGDDEDFFSVDSCVESDQQGPDLITEMINRTKIVNYDPTYKDNMIMLSDSEENNILPEVSVAKKQIIKKTHLPDGILHYKLSDRTFINKGYTILPVIKVMKRINLYKMDPVNPQFNWFERHKDVGTKNYDTGEILAVIKENGTGKWFYKNGRIALDYYNAEDVISGQRYVLYSSGEESNQRDRLMESKNKPQVIGVFDLIGNGVVYDLNGKERIKYNQSEGVIMDCKIAPVSRWKWNSLNDPPQFDSILVDNYESSFTAKEDERKRNQNPEVLKTELKNFAKQKAHKLLQKFKPFQIRMKAFKVNDEFSIRIIDQANIYLLFRHGTVSMKLNLGLHLVSNEIVDTDEAEIGGMSVATPYDRIPAKTSSIINIQQNLQNVRDLQSQRQSSTKKVQNTK